MKSSMFMLWVVTTILSYGSKIPFIKQIISMLSLWYGRTTFWKILVKLRKLFIIFNALIGVFMVYKTVGFSYDNVLAGFAGMGHNYLEIFTSFTKRLFNWFVELFDHKVIPNVPGESGGGYKKVWTPIEKSVLQPQSFNSGGVENSLRKSYNSLLNIQVEPESTSWYKNLNTWLWIGGLICIAYLGYKFIIDPLFIEDVGKGKNIPKPSNLPRTTVTAPSPEISLSERAGQAASDFSESTARGIGRVFRRIRRGINPFNWFETSEDVSKHFALFMEKQNVMETADRRYYPFTEINPFLPWHQQLKINIFGESVMEAMDRFKARQIAERVINSLSVTKGKYLGFSGVTPAVTPPNWIGSVGFTTPIPKFAIAETIQSLDVSNKFKALTPTPTMVPAVSESVLHDVAEWKTYEKAQWTEADDRWYRVGKEIRQVPGIKPSTTLPASSLPVHNKVDVLEVE